MRAQVAIFALTVAATGVQGMQPYPLHLSAVHAGTTQSARTEVRRGVVRGDRRAFVDDGGPFLARGATLFWGLWGYQHDRERLGRNLGTLRDWGFHYVRVLGQVGAPPSQSNDSWRDRRVDPNTSTYDADIAGLTDWAYQNYGLRVQWTIFGGVDFTPTPDARQHLVQRFAAMSRGREQELFGFEIANESWQNGFAGEKGREELRALGRLMNSSASVLVALSSSPGARCDGPDGLRELYARSAADFTTLHFGRREAHGAGAWNLLEEPSKFRACTGVPILASSNESIGPETSVAALDDPLILSTLAFVTYGSGIGAFVMHSGPGVRGGGAADLVLGRRGNLWELPTAGHIADGLRTLDRLLPADFPNWEQQDSTDKSPDRPFDLENRRALSGLYCFAKGLEAVCTAAGIVRPLELIARRNLTVTARHPLDGRSMSTKEMLTGDRFALTTDPPAALLQIRYR